VGTGLKRQANVAAREPEVREAPITSKKQRSRLMDALESPMAILLPAA